MLFLKSGVGSWVGLRVTARFSTRWCCLAYWGRCCGAPRRVCTCAEGQKWRHPGSGSLVSELCSLGQQSRIHPLCLASVHSPLPHCPLASCQVARQLLLPEFYLRRSCFPPVTSEGLRLCPCSDLLREGLTCRPPRERSQDCAAANAHTGCQPAPEKVHAGM